jgi:hypothetical protein
MRNLFKEAWEFYSEALHLEAVKARTQIDTIELAHDIIQQDGDLGGVASTYTERMKLLDMAILLAQLGIRAEEVEEMARLYHLSNGYGVSTEDMRHISAIIHRPR